jgi:hypothetical protein
MSASDIEICAKRVRAVSQELPGSVEDIRCAEQVAEALFDVHETFAIFARLLSLLGGWYEHVAQVAEYAPPGGLPTPALHTYPGLAEVPSVAP